MVVGFDGEGDNAGFFGGQLTGGAVDAADIRVAGLKGQRVGRGVFGKDKKFRIC